MSLDEADKHIAEALHSGWIGTELEALQGISIAWVLWSQATGKTLPKECCAWYVAHLRRIQGKLEELVACAPMSLSVNPYTPKSLLFRVNAMLASFPELEA